MRRVFLLLGACLVMSLVFAPAAMAQKLTAEDYGPEDRGGYGCEADQYFATAPWDPGEGTGACFDTAEDAASYSNTGKVPGPTSQPAPQQTAPSDASTAQYDEDDVPALPDTGGPALGAIAAVLGGALLAGGLLLRRRLS